MGETTGIAWAHSTFNPWLGCQRVSPGCEHCYAETLVTGRMCLPVWGPTAERHRTSVSNWNLPLRWNRKAAKTGQPWRVFCASLADVFEDRRDLDPWRADLFRLIDATPHLTWMLLTKRPENILRLMPPSSVGEPRRNVWFGATVEDSKRARERVPELVQAGCRGYTTFLSLEPMLEVLSATELQLGEVDWAIFGGESGPEARWFPLTGTRLLIQECRRFGVAPFMKQMGELWAKENNAKSRHGADPAEWPEDLRVQEFPR